MTAGYFSTFRTLLSSGREFTPADVATSQPVAIVNESFARTHFPNVDATGRQIKRIRPNSKEPWLTIVGVVPDIRYRPGDSDPVVYVPYLAAPRSTASLLARTSLQPPAADRTV